MSIYCEMQTAYFDFYIGSLENIEKRFNIESRIITLFRNKN